MVKLIVTPTACVCLAVLLTLLRPSTQYAISVGTSMTAKHDTNVYSSIAGTPEPVRTNFSNTDSETTTKSSKLEQSVKSYLDLEDSARPRTVTKSNDVASKYMRELFEQYRRSEFELNRGNMIRSIRPKLGYIANRYVPIFNLSGIRDREQVLHGEVHYRLKPSSYWKKRGKKASTRNLVALALDAETGRGVQLSIVGVQQRNSPASPDWIVFDASELVKTLRSRKSSGDSSPIFGIRFGHKRPGKRFPKWNKRPSKLLRRHTPFLVVYSDDSRGAGTDAGLLQDMDSENLLSSISQHDFTNVYEPNDDDDTDRQSRRNNGKDIAAKQDEPNEAGSSNHHEGVRRQKHSGASKSLELQFDNFSKSDKFREVKKHHHVSESWALRRKRRSVDVVNQPQPQHYYSYSVDTEANNSMLASEKSFEIDLNDNNSKPYTEHELAKNRRRKHNITAIKTNKTNIDFDSDLLPDDTWDTNEAEFPFFDSVDYSKNDRKDSKKRNHDIEQNRSQSHSSWGPSALFSKPRKGRKYKKDNKTTNKYRLSSSAHNSNIVVPSYAKGPSILLTREEMRAQRRWRRKHLNKDRNTNNNDNRSNIENRETSKQSRRSSFRPRQWRHRRRYGEDVDAGQPPGSSGLPGSTYWQKFHQHQKPDSQPDKMAYVESLAVRTGSGVHGAYSTVRSSADNNGTSGVYTRVVLLKPEDASESEYPAFPSVASGVKEPFCKKRRLFVRFADIGWNDWIIAPEGIDANYCQGSCHSRPGKSNLRQTNHAIIQNIARALSLDANDPPPPCCAPDKMDSLTLLYFDEAGNVVMKNYPKMVVKSCACL